MTRKHDESKIERALKEEILKTGFPMENEIFHCLSSMQTENSNIHIDRDVAFHTLNEFGEPTIRSVDFVVTISFKSKNTYLSRAPLETLRVRFVIDSKWIAVPVYLVPYNRTKKLPSEALHAFPIFKPKNGSAGPPPNNSAGLQVQISENECSRGIRSSGGERDTIVDSVVQVTLGAVAMMKLDMDAALAGEGYKDGDLNYFRDAYVYIPVLVTNAELRLLNRSLTPQDLETRAENFFAVVSSGILPSPDLANLKERYRQMILPLRRQTWGDSQLNWSCPSDLRPQTLICNPKEMRVSILRIIEKWTKLLNAETN